MYKLPIHLHEKFIRNANLKNVVLRCWHDGIEYNQMLEMALSVQTERTEYLERRLLKDNLKAKEQRIIGIEMLVGKFGTNRNNEIHLHDYFEITPNEAYDYCDEIYGGDSQHIRGKAESIKLSTKIQKT